MTPSPIVAALGAFLMALAIAVAIMSGPMPGGAVLLVGILGIGGLGLIWKSGVLEVRG